MGKNRGKQPQDQSDDELQVKIGEARDELNLAEFPLCCIADRPEPGQKTLSFEDRTWDTNRSEFVTRRLLITGSDEYGLPTALDDEVLLGLIQVSKVQNFADRKVPFTRYQLIRLLDWRDEGKSYERLEKSLNRWMGVTLYYKNAWRDRSEQCWADAKFHILDNVILFDREKMRRKRPSIGKRQTQLAFSTFIWNEVIFRSFKAGNLKSIDFEFWKRLESSISKRLYRFLDKRFYHRRRWKFNLKELCWEHLGLARSYDAANLKRKLRPALSELEAAGFLKSSTEENRFQRVCSGEWRVVLEHAKQAQSPEKSPLAPASAEREELKAALTKRGVSLVKAMDIVSLNPLELVRTQLDRFDWLMARRDPKVSRNPVGFLVSSIQSDYSSPKGYASPEEREQSRMKTDERARQTARREQRREAEMTEEARAQEEAINCFWNSMSDEERNLSEAEAVQRAPQFERDLLQNGGTLGAIARKRILDGYALRKSVGSTGVGKGAGREERSSSGSMDH